MNTQRIIATLAFATTTSLVSAAPFTYQGSLQDAGAPADGIYDFRFELYDAAIGGTQIGPTLVFENTPVSEGTFQENLDFGNGIFNNTDYYISIEIREGTSGGLFSTLLPRSPITATPKAQHATTADSVLNTQWTQTPTQLSYGDGTQRVFVNRDFPITSNEYFGVHGNVAGFVGMYTSGPADSFPFYGYSVDGATSAYTYFQPSDNSWNLVSNNNFALQVDSTQNLHVSNDAHAANFQFNQPQIHWYSIPGDVFHSASNDPFIGSSGNGGTYIDAPGVGWLVAPVNLPDGATVTSMTAYFDDTAAGSMSISLSQLTHGGGSFFSRANIDTAGSNGTGLNLSDTGVDYEIDNRLSHYHLRIYSSNWPGDSRLKIKSVLISYIKTKAD